MKGFPIQNIALSLAFPWANLVASVVYLISQQYLGLHKQDGFGAHMAALATIVLGGVFPIILTLAAKIDTSSYFKQRLIPSVLIVICDKLLYEHSGGTALFWLIGAEWLCNLLYQILHVQDELTTGGKRAVMQLSDPVFYYTVFICLCQARRLLL